MEKKGAVLGAFCRLGLDVKFIGNLVLESEKGFQWRKVLARVRPSGGPPVASCRVAHLGKYGRAAAVRRTLAILNLILLCLLLGLEYYTLKFASDFLLCVALNDVHK